MGQEGHRQVPSVSADVGLPPKPDEFELTLIGPGYGESVVVHLGRGAWVIVDSCVDRDGVPRPVRYLECLGIDPSEAVCLVIASHWHDDHIRGLAKVVAKCSRARFCCSAALRAEEFLAAVGRTETRSHSRVSSGLREIHQVLSQLDSSRRPIWALADRRLHQLPVGEVRALSPDDSTFERFLRSVGGLLPDRGEAKRRIVDLSPNEVSVALWARGAEVVVLLGADLERSGWTRIVDRYLEPEGQASAFKVPHHGSEGAHEPRVWQELLRQAPVAVLAPWTRGGRTLPTARDVRRLLKLTPRLYAPAPPHRTSAKAQLPAVGRTLREIGAEVRRHRPSHGAVRLRRPLDGSEPWCVEALGSAVRLGDDGQSS